jgi:alkanesulfonate monooxygenase SsuD/methylene tetrahydromethanopterin reductase-like flavin-dependent oxidoreductase (luciferase family)
MMDIDDDERSARIRELTNQLRELLAEAGEDVRARFWKSRQADKTLDLLRCSRPSDDSGTSR